MITSSHQRNALAERIAQLEQQLEVPAKPGVPEHIMRMARSQLAEDIDALKGEIAEYESACQADLHNYVFHGYEDFLKFPIVIRLSRGMSQQDFARRVGISLSQLKRYEAATYRNAPTSVVNRILESFRLQYSARISQAS